jgi:hypothetical protein
MRLGSYYAEGGQVRVRGVSAAGVMVPTVGATAVG